MKFLMATAQASSEPQEEDNDQGFLEYLMSKDVVLSKDTAEAIAYALALSTDPNEPKSSALKRLKKYILSTGRHGNSPFIVAHFGGAGEVTQGFCRACDVSSGTYILGREYTITRTSSASQANQPSTPTDSQSASSEEYPFQISIQDLEETLRARLLVSTERSLPTQLRPRVQDDVREEMGKTLRRCIAVLDGDVYFQPRKPQAENEEDAEGIEEDGEVDTAVLVFPPNSLSTGGEGKVVTAYIAGPGGMNCPDGKRVVYLSTELTEGERPETVLEPYLEAMRTLNGEKKADMSLYYAQALSGRTASSTETNAKEQATANSNRQVMTGHDGIVTLNTISDHLAEFGDEAAAEGARVFWEVVTKLGLDGRGLFSTTSNGETAEGKSGEEAGQVGEAGHGDGEELIAVVWPPLGAEFSDD